MKYQRFTWCSESHHFSYLPAINALTTTWRCFFLIYHLLLYTTTKTVFSRFVAKSLSHTLIFFRETHDGRKQWKQEKLLELQYLSFCNNCFQNKFKHNTFFVSYFNDNAITVSIRTCLMEKPFEFKSVWFLSAADWLKSWDFLSLDFAGQVSFNPEVICVLRRKNSANQVPIYLLTIASLYVEKFSI